MVEILFLGVKCVIIIILFDQGYIMNYKFEEDGKQGMIKIVLKYNQFIKVFVIMKIVCVFCLGFCKYSGVDSFLCVLNGFGIVIVFIFKGVIIDKQVRKENVGGEVFCYVY